MDYSVFDNITGVGVLPVIKIEERSHALPLANALRDGGINAIEVTARSSAAFDAIADIAKKYPDMAIGAGTIHNTALCIQALEAGARFIVTPGYSESVVRFCTDQGIPVVPGCSSATDMELAAEAGVRVVKFFPAEMNGGPAALKLFSGPFPMLRFVPTGGITFDNLSDYLKLDCVAACGGSFMANAAMIRSGSWDAITQNCQRAIRLSMGFELAHVGINQPSREAAIQVAESLSELIPMEVHVGGKSTFLGSAVEVMHTIGNGANGHIGFKVNSVERAMAYFKAKGIAVKENNNASTKDIPQFFYLEEEVGGFAIHVVKREGGSV